MSNFNDINFKTLYLRRSASALSDLIVTFIMSTVITGLLFWMSSWLWTIYSHTNIGETFSNIDPELAADINNAFRPWCIEIAIFSNIVSLIASLLLGAASQLIHVQRFFYESLGKNLRIMIWGGGISFFVSLFLSYQYSINNLKISFVFAIPSTVMLLGKTFAFTSITLPELGEIITKLTSRFSVKIKDVKTTFLNQVHDAISDIENTKKK